MISWNLQSTNIFIGKPIGHIAYTTYVNKYGIIRLFKKISKSMNMINS